MPLFIATRGEHVHVRPKSGRMKRKDPVRGYSIVGYEYEDERYQDTIIVVDGQRSTLEELRASLPGNMRVDTIPFPPYKGCCSLEYKRG